MRHVCQELNASPSPVEGETATKVTKNVWKYEVDWSCVRSNRKGLTAHNNTTVSTRALRVSRASTRSKTGKRK